MPLRLALGAFALMAIYAGPASARNAPLYYCDPLHLYYPAVPTCPMPWRPVQAAPMTASGSGQRGAADWRGLRAWFESQSGDRWAGADYWAANRSNANHKSCDDAAGEFGEDKAAFIAGCRDAMAQLNPIDAKRLHDPQYRAGFNAAARAAPLPAGPATRAFPAGTHPPSDTVSALATQNPPSAEPSSVPQADTQQPAFAAGIYTNQNAPSKETVDGDTIFRTRVREACEVKPGTDDATRAELAKLCLDMQVNQMPPCFAYSAFARVYFRMSDEGRLSLAFAEDAWSKMNRDGKYSDEFYHSLEPLIELAYHQKDRWATATDFSDAAYKACMAGHLFSTQEQSATTRQPSSSTEPTPPPLTPAMPGNSAADDPCLRPEIRSSGAISFLNAKIGQPDGPPSRVIAIENPSLPAFHGAPPVFLICNVTLVFGDGRREPGTISFKDPGGSSPLRVSWESNATKIAHQRAAQAQFDETPEGKVVKSRQVFYADDGRSRCVIQHQNDVNVLESCSIDPKWEGALGAMDYVASIRSSAPRMPGMSIGGHPAWVTPWVNAHCQPMVAGYRCEWKGLELEYQ